MIFTYSLPFCGLLFHFVDFFIVQKRVSVTWFHFKNVCFVLVFWVSYSKNLFLRLLLRSFLPISSSKGFMVSSLMFKTLIHFELLS